MCMVSLVCILLLLIFWTLDVECSTTLQQGTIRCSWLDHSEGLNRSSMQVPHACPHWRQGLSSQLLVANCMQHHSNSLPTAFQSHIMFLTVKRWHTCVQRPRLCDCFCLINGSCLTLSCTTLGSPRRTQTPGTAWCWHQCMF